MYKHQKLTTFNIAVIPLMAYPTETKTIILPIKMKDHYVTT